MYQATSGVQVRVDQLVDRIFQEIGLSTDDIISSPRRAINRVCKALPEFENDIEYINILVAWTYTTTEVSQLYRYRRCHHPNLRRLAEVCVVLRMQTRAAYGELAPSPRP